jgi:hypothetical protein
LTNHAPETRVLLWHPVVHQYFEESLYYFLIRFGTYTATTYSQLRAFLEDEPGLPGYCMYTVLGIYDLLLRIWLNPVAYARLDQFLPDKAGIAQVLAFRVDKQLHWKFGELADDGALLRAASKYTEDDYEQVQKGLDPDTARRMEDDGLFCNEILTPPTRVKFYTVVGEPLPAYSPLRDMIAEQVPKIAEDFHKIVRRARQSSETLTRVSIYEGAGFGWILFKGVVDDVHLASELAITFRGSLSRFGVTTTTLVIGDPDPLEKDYLSPGSLRREAQIDRRVAAFLPELYSTRFVEPQRRRVIESYLNEKDIFRDLEPIDAEFMGNLVLAAAVSEAGGVAELSDQLSGWFRDTERELRDMTESALIVAATAESKSLQTIGEELGITKAQRTSSSLGDLLLIAAGMLERLGKFALTGDVKNAFVSISKLRNDVQHGKTLPDWRQVLDVVHAFLTIYRKLISQFSVIIEESRDETH